PLAYAPWFFLSWIGTHKFYLGKIGEGMAYIFLPWVALFLFVGGLITINQDGSPFLGLLLPGSAALVAYAIWWFVDLFTLHSQVERFNEQLEVQIIRSIQRSARWVFAKSRKHMGAPYPRSLYLLPRASSQER
ncbi:MAG: TM2 domain-containing protein, partial [Candidatus Tectomicrobia bacterium]|nr:TM2 domain-containing protein [Candidatus Tectomicrobia bacterium]